MTKTKSANQKEFARHFNRLCGKYSRYNVWQDFVWLTAISIANTLDKRHAKEREERYMSILQKYEKDERNEFPALLGIVENSLEEDPDQDLLGELYMTMELGSDATGQFFTPYHISKAMATLAINKDMIQSQMAGKGYITINEPSCGAGASLMAVANVLLDRGVNYQQKAFFVAQDIDYTVGLMCYIQLSLMGCAGYVRIGDTLANPSIGPMLHGDGGADTWYTPMWFSGLWSARRIVETIKARKEQAHDTQRVCG